MTELSPTAGRQKHRPAPAASSPARPLTRAAPAVFRHVAGRYGLARRPVALRRRAAAAGQRAAHPDGAIDETVILLTLSLHHY